MKIEYGKRTNRIGDLDQYTSYGIWINNKVALGFTPSFSPLLHGWEKYFFIGYARAEWTIRILWFQLSIKQYNIKIG